ncbi:MAG: GDP-mannose 4,6-dehydratase [Anaerolineaceae bacterium]|nr:GDP-mannose 4,6-dehydratase [Anaerolineaceae bacterium]MDD4043348.1 GDP-mannose 4,6-dehydratase [Anaerolineaceae bacterium]MDD4578166.1 GDP-mannose 4,6-dehydratase [Anaerolineaceae bacterium]
MQILITGAAGFLGSHLTDRFLSEGHQVIGLDNFITGNRENIAHLIGNPNFTLMEQDVSTYISVAEPLDFVLHFASPASPSKSSPLGYPNLPIQTMKAGALGTHNGLGLALKHHAKFLLASTSEVYGDPLIHPQPETYWGNCDPVGVRSVYDEAKRFAEALTMAYHNFHGVDTRIVRIFNTFGPRMRLDDGRSVPNFIQQALRKEPLTIYGTGEQTRSFCYVDDLVEGIRRLMDSDEHLPVNIGNPREVSINDFARQINEICNNPAGLSINASERLGDDPERRQPDITKAKALLGWEPVVSTREGLTRTIDYFRDKLAQQA